MYRKVQNPKSAGAAGNHKHQGGDSDQGYQRVIDPGRCRDRMVTETQTEENTQL